ncbi:MAG TPA: glycosyltransferase family 2 protein [Actinobacteria bacterium]|nr:glycosyltransferase family 2 protein [Actinomycetes bacterium]HEX21483.1 glycosyltransferase family 2 protein [Actinomycetota bacterium]
MLKLDVTIAVINWNTKELLAACLNSLFKAQPLVGFEVRVIDNHSTDGSVQLVERDFPQVDIVENAGNLGFAAAANQALRQSSARYVFILNSDTEIEQDTIDILVDFADSHERAAVVGPALFNADGSTQITGRNFPSFSDSIMHAFLGVLWHNNPWSVRYKMLDWDRRSERSVDWVSGAAMFVRREAAQEVNFFDENFFMYVEDLDFCYRLRQKNWQVYFYPQAKAMHHIGKSSEQTSNKMIVEFQKSMYRFYNKKYQHSWRRFLKPLVVVGLGLRIILLISISYFRRVSAGMRPKPSKKEV